MTGKAEDVLEGASPASAAGPANPVPPPAASGQGSMARLGPAGRRFLPLLPPLVAVVLALAPLFPWKVTLANAPPDRFSAGRAMAHLPVLAAVEALLLSVALPAVDGLFRGGRAGTPLHYAGKPAIGASRNLEGSSVTQY